MSRAGHGFRKMAAVAAAGKVHCMKASWEVGSQEDECESDGSGKM